MLSFNVGRAPLSWIGDIAVIRDTFLARRKTDDVWLAFSCDSKTRIYVYSSLRASPILLEPDEPDVTKNLVSLRLGNAHILTP